MKRTLTKVSVLSALMILLSACQDDDDTNIAEEGGDSPLESFYNALGSEESINQVASIGWNSVGKSFEFQQDGEPIMDFVADFSYELDASSDFLAWRQQWTVDTDYFFEVDLAFTETVDGQNGASQGTTSFLSRNFSALGVPGDPMFSTKMAARRKALILSSPITLAKLTMAEAEGSLEIDGGVITIDFEQSIIGVSGSLPAISIQIDEQTGLPSRAFTTENDPLLGDVVYEVSYDLWVSVGEVNFPTEITHSLNGAILRREMLSEPEVNQDISDVAVDQNTDGFWPFDATEALAGHLSSQFHFRMMMIGAAIDFPTTLTDANFQPPLILAASGPVPDDATTIVVGGDLQLHYTYAFDVGDEIILYDTPYNNRRMQAVLNKTRELLGDKPISNVVVSHNHFDHAGGFRSALVEGGSLIVGGANAAVEFEDLLARPHTVLPNPLGSPTGVEVVGLEDSISFGEGDNEVQFHVIPNQHSDDENLILAYKPATNTIFLSDLFNPGFQLVFPEFSPASQELLVERAKDVVDFITEKGWDIDFVYATHGFVDQDNAALARLVELSNM